MVQPTEPNDIQKKIVDGSLVVAIPSLAPPAYNKWHSWADEHLRLVSLTVAAFIAETEEGQ